MTTPRLSGPCVHGDHDYCLGPRMLLPCNCDCHEHQDTPNRRRPVTIPDEAVAAAAKAMYEQRPEDVPKAWRRGQHAAARAVLEAALPWLQATKNGGDQ